MSEITPFKHPIEFYARLSRAVYENNESEVNKIIADAHVTPQCSALVRGWKVMVFLDKELGEVIIAGRGTSSVSNWKNNADAHLTHSPIEWRIRKRIQKTIKCWEHTFGHHGPVVLTGHSGVVRYQATPKKPGIYFNPDGAIDAPNNLNLRTEDDVVTGILEVVGKQAKSITMGPGKHSMDDCIEASKGFSQAQYYRELNGLSLPFYIPTPFREIPRLSLSDHCAFSKCMHAASEMKGNRKRKDLYSNAFEAAKPYLDPSDDKLISYHNQTLLAASLTLTQQKMGKEDIQKTLEKTSEQLKSDAYWTESTEPPPDIAHLIPAFSSVRRLTEMKGAAERAKAIAVTVKEELSKAGTKINVGELARDVAKTVLKYQQLSHKERRVSAEGKKLLEEFKFKREFLGFRQEITDFHGRSQSQIHRDIFRSAQPKHLNNYVEEMDKSIDAYTKRIDQLESYLSNRHQLDDALSNDLHQLDQFDDRIETKFREASHQWSRIHKLLNFGEAILGFVIPNKEIVEIAGKIGQQVVEQQREKLHNEFEKVSNQSLEARRIFQGAKGQNTDRMHQLDVQMSDLHDFCIHSPHLFNPQTAFPILEKARTYYQDKESELKQKIAANKQKISEHQHQQSLQQLDVLSRSRKDEPRAAITVLEGKIRDLEQLNRSLAEQLDSNISQREAAEARITKEKSLEQFTNHYWKWVAKQQPHLDEPTQELHKTLGQISELVKNQLDYKYAPPQQTLSAFHQLAEGIQTLFGTQIPVSAVAFLENIVEICKQGEKLQFGWRQFSDLKSQMVSRLDLKSGLPIQEQRGYWAAYEIMETGAFATSIVVPGLQIVTAGVAIASLLKTAYTAATEEKKENPLQALAEFITHQLEEVVKYQTKQFDFLHRELQLTIQEEGSQNREKVNEVLAALSGHRIHIHQMGDEIIDEMRSMELRLNIKLDEASVIKLKQNVDNRLIEIKRISRKMTNQSQQDYLEQLKSEWDISCHPVLNGWLEDENFPCVPFAYIAATPEYYTGLLASQMEMGQGETMTCPSLYLFSHAVAPFIDYVGQLDIHSLLESEREELLTACQHAQKLGLRLTDLLNQLRPFIDRAVNAKKNLHAAVPKSEQFALRIQEDLLVRNEQLIFDFDSQLGEKRRVGAQKFLLSDVFHNAEMLSKDIISQEPNIRGYVKKLFSLSFQHIHHLAERKGLTRYSPEVYLLLFPFYRNYGMEKMMKEEAPSFVAKVISLGSKKIGQIPAEDNFNLEINTSQLHTVQIIVQTRLVEPSSKALESRLYILDPFLLTSRVKYTRITDEQQRWNSEIQSSLKSKNIFNLTFTFNYVSPQHYAVQAGPNALFQIEDWQKTPPPAFQDSETYDTHLQTFFDDYREYLQSQILLSDVKESNLFLQKMGPDSENCVVSSIRMGMIPLVFPKTYVDAWTEQLDLDNDLKKMRGIFMPLYDLVHSPDDKTYQLVIEFCYFNMNHPERKKYQQIVAAEFDAKTVDCYQKITITDDEYHIEPPNLNEFLLQAMYTDLFKEGGLPDRFSHRLKNGSYVAAHESPFIGLYRLLKYQPHYRLNFKSEKYDPEVHEKLEHFMRTEEPSDLGNFVTLAKLESGDDYSYVHKIIKKARKEPYVEEFTEFKNYEERYHLLLAFSRLVCGRNKMELHGIMEEYLGLEIPNRHRSPKEDKDGPAIEAFTEIIKHSPSVHLTGLQQQMASLDRISIALSENK